MAGGKKFAVFAALAIFLGYLSYVPYPEACDFPVAMKAFYSFTRFATHVSNFLHYMGGDYQTFFRLIEFDFSRHNAEGVDVTSNVLGGVPTTIFKPTDFASHGPGAAIVFYHGGGWVLGSVELYTAFMKALTRQTGMIVIFPEYRLAPEYPFPIPFNDCLSATLDFFDRLEEFNVDAEKIILSGDSAGGNLATAISLRLGNEKAAIKPCMLNVMYPVLQMSNFMLPSYQQNPNPPMANPGMMAHFFLLYMGMPKETRLVNPMISGLHMAGFQHKTFAGKINHTLLPEKFKRRKPNMVEYKPTVEDHALIEEFGDVLQGYASDPEFAPLSASDDEIKSLPTTYIVTCEYDILRDDGIILHERMNALGMDVRLDNWEFGAHGILTVYGEVGYEKLYDAVQRMINNMTSTLLKCQGEPRSVRAK